MGDTETTDLRDYHAAVRRGDLKAVIRIIDKVIARAEASGDDTEMRTYLRAASSYATHP